MKITNFQLIRVATITTIYTIGVSVYGVVNFIRFFPEYLNYNYLYLVWVMLPSFLVLGLLGVGLYGLLNMSNRGVSNWQVRLLRSINLITVLYIPVEIYQALYISPGYVDFVNGALPLMTILTMIVSVICFASLFLLHYRNEAKHSILVPSETYFLPSKWKRLVNVLIDGVVVLALTAGNAYLLINNTVGSYGQSTPYRMTVNIFIILIPWVIYYSLTEWIYGQSFGKVVTNTRVFYHAENKRNFRTLLTRSIIRLIPLEFLSIFGLDDNMWHDQWTDTEVLDYDATKSRSEASQFQGDILDDVWVE